MCMLIYRIIWLTVVVRGCNFRWQQRLKLRGFNEENKLQGGKTLYVNLDRYKE